MSEYKHGSWYCVPVNGDEAREIIARAVASGAVNAAGFYGSCSHGAYGVFNGRVYSYGSRPSVTQYTIAELRQKFPLPGESVEPEAWSPKAGDHVEIDMSDFVSDRRETGETATVLSISVNSNGNTVAMIEIDGRNGECDAVNVRALRPLRTEREKWVEDVMHELQDWPDTFIPCRGIIQQIFDAIKSGALKAPEAE